MSYEFSKELPVKEIFTPELIDMLVPEMHKRGCNNNGHNCMHGGWILDSKLMESIGKSGFAMSVALQIGLALSPADLAYVLSVGVYIGREIERIYAAGETVESAISEERKAEFNAAKEQVDEIPQGTVEQIADKLIRRLTQGEMGIADAKAHGMRLKKKKDERPSPGFPTEDINFPIQ